MITVTAPGRINLIGEHIDYLDGCVMPVAIERTLRLEATPIEGREIRVHSQGKVGRISLDHLQPVDRLEDYWLNYIVGVIAGYKARGVDCPAFEASISSTIPAGAGLSSSAALETATGLVVEALTGAQLTPLERALLCQHAEHTFAGVPCGIMDQLAVGACQAGHALLVDCRDNQTRLVKLPGDLAILVTDTEVKHALGDGEYRKRREACEAACGILGASSLRDVTLAQVEAAEEELGPRLFRRARHAVTEMVRVKAFAEALTACDRARIGELMRGSHDSLRDDFEVSCPELDLLVDAAYAFGAPLVGARMTGGGFGGSMICLVEEDAASALAAHLETAFEAKMDRAVHPFVTKAAAAAGVEPPAFGDGTPADTV